MLGIVIDIGRSRMAERPRVSDRFYTLNHGRLYVRDANLRPGGALRGKQRIISCKARGEMWKTEIFKVVAHVHVS
jgi:hypothetical protein